MSAVGVLTGGLLLIGFAAPSLADTGVDAPSTPSVSVQATDGAAGTDPATSAPSARTAATTSGDLPDPTDVAECATSDDPWVCIADMNDGCDDQPPYDDPCPPADGGSDPGTGDPCSVYPAPPGCPGSGDGNGDGNGNGNGGGSGDNGNGNGGGTGGGVIPGLPGPGTGGGHGGGNGGGNGGVIPGLPGGGSGGGTGGGGNSGSGGTGGSAPQAGSPSDGGPQVEGSRPGSDVQGVSDGLTACTDVICRNTAPTVAARTAPTQAAGSTLPQTGAAQDLRGVALLGALLVLWGAWMMRPRPAARHRTAD